MTNAKQPGKSPGRHRSSERLDCPLERLSGANPLGAAAIPVFAQTGAGMWQTAFSKRATPKVSFTRENGTNAAVNTVTFFAWI
jgi:hypothetical protein